jgi:hypothetical protein
MAPIDNFVSSSSAGGLFYVSKSLHNNLLGMDMSTAICISDQIR